MAATVLTLASGLVPLLGAMRFLDFGRRSPLRCDLRRLSVNPSGTLRVGYWRFLSTFQVGVSSLLASLGVGVWRSELGALKRRLIHNNDPIQLWHYSKR